MGRARRSPRIRPRASRSCSAPGSSRWSPDACLLADRRHDRDRPVPLADGDVSHRELRRGHDPVDRLLRVAAAARARRPAGVRRAAARDRGRRRGPLARRAVRRGGRHACRTADGRLARRRRLPLRRHPRPAAQHAGRGPAPPRRPIARPDPRRGAQRGPRRRALLRERATQLVTQSIYWNTVNIGTGLILLLGAQAMRTGDFTVGDFALFVSYLGFVTEFTGFAGMFLTQYKQLNVSVRRMLAPMRGEATGVVAEGLVARTPLFLHGPLPETVRRRGGDLRTLEARGLSYRYGIRDVSLRVERGTFTVVTGRIGAG